MLTNGTHFCSEVIIGSRFSFLFFAVLGFEFRASRLLGRHSLYSLSQSISPFFCVCVGYFQDRVSRIVAGFKSQFS
jgi:hypothetical protein